MEHIERETRNVREVRHVPESVMTSSSTWRTDKPSRY